MLTRKQIAVWMLDLTCRNRTVADVKQNVNMTVSWRWELQKEAGDTMKYRDRFSGLKGLERVEK